MGAGLWMHCCLKQLVASVAVQHVQRIGSTWLFRIVSTYKYDRNTSQVCQSAPWKFNMDPQTKRLIWWENDFLISISLSLFFYVNIYIYTNINTYTYTLIIIHLHVFIWGCWWSTFCGGEHIIRFPSVHSLEISRAPLAQVREGDHTIVAKNGFHLTQATLGFASENCQTWFVISHYIRVHNHCC